jgi:adenosine deaminase
LAVTNHVTIEMNPRSNNVLNKIKSLTDLHIDSLLARGVSVTVNSDDPALWPHGWISDVVYGVCRSYHFGLETVDRLISNAIDGAFIGKSDRQSLHELYRESRRGLS